MGTGLQYGNAQNDSLAFPVVRQNSMFSGKFSSAVEIYWVWL